MRKLTSIRIIAPSSGSDSSSMVRKKWAVETLKKRGYVLSFGQNISKTQRFGTASVQDRVSDLEAAYLDKGVDMILCYSGGWSVNAILPRINWQIIKDNPKPLVGFSDITALVNAIYAKTGTKNGLLGPTLGLLSERFESDYTYSFFDAVINKEVPIKLSKSQSWSPRNRNRFSTAWKIIQPGNAQGVAIGGNLGTFYLLQGTPYMPKFDLPTVLLLEDDDEAGKYTAREFNRRLESILQQPGARKNIVGVMVGRFLPTSKVSFNDIKDSIRRAELGNIPVVSNMDFGHSVPMFTVPIGSIIKLDVKNRISCEILEI